jgi:hypothetical protein
VGSAITPVSSTPLRSGDTGLCPEPSRHRSMLAVISAPADVLDNTVENPSVSLRTPLLDSANAQINANVVPSGDRPVHGVRRPHTSADANAWRMLSSLTTRRDGRSRRAWRARRAPQCAAVARNPPEGALPSTDLGRSTMRIRKRWGLTCMISRLPCVPRDLIVSLSALRVVNVMRQRAMSGAYIGAVLFGSDSRSQRGGPPRRVRGSCSCRTQPAGASRPVVSLDRREVPAAAPW